ncbi:hypothetical protein Tco_0238488 [Tanacetum coccineum]
MNSCTCPDVLSHGYPSRIPAQQWKPRLPSNSPKRKKKGEKPIITSCTLTCTYPPFYVVSSIDHRLDRQNPAIPDCVK